MKTMFKVTGSDNLVYGLVDTREAANKIVEQKTKMGRNSNQTPAGANATKVSTMTFRVEEVNAKGNHPGY